MIDWTKVKKVYFVGIKGGGMSALARLLKGKGFEVSGSDVEEEFFSDQLLSASGIEVFTPFTQSNIPTDADLFIYSTAYTPDHNEEVAYLQNFSKVPVLSYPEAVGEIMSLYRTIAIAGTHGKTTTTALISFILQRAGYDPSAIIGSAVPQFKGNALVGQSPLLVVEADEYQNKFRYYQPDILLVNNIDWDHPDFFADQKSYLDTFIDFINKVPNGGFVVANHDDQMVRRAVEQSKSKAEIIWFSRQEREVDWFIEDSNFDDRWQYFSIYKQGEKWQAGKSQLFGRFNLSNITAAVALTAKLGVSAEKLMAAVADFQGTVKRFEYKGEVKGIKMYDDFAHHPSEIKATLQMARRRFADKKIIVVFQPHTYSRTQKFFTDFSKSFAGIDQVIILDIFSSAREKKGEISSAQLVEAINKEKGRAIYLPTAREACIWLKDKLQAGDILITMGAGKADQVIDLMKNG